MLPHRTLYGMLQCSSCSRRREGHRRESSTVVGPLAQWFWAPRVQVKEVFHIYRSLRWVFGRPTLRTDGLRDGKNVLECEFSRSALVVLHTCHLQHSQEPQGRHVVEDVRWEGGDVVVQNCSELRVGFAVKARTRRRTRKQDAGIVCTVQQPR